MLGAALKELRVFHRLTQQDVADTLGISKSYLSEIENNHKSPNLDLLERYSMLYEIPASSLLLFSENLSEKKKSDAFRMKCVDKIIKVLEWVNEREDFAERKKAKAKDQNKE
jgi:transcriptional regulator with XRE-family HTH domain